MLAKEWDKHYEDGTYIEHVPHSSLARFEARWMAGDRVLDFGCGAGRHTAFLAEKGYDTYGVDISEEALSRTATLLKQKNLTADLRQVSNYTSGYFDTVVSFGVLDHVLPLDAKKLISEIHRLLKPDGFLCITLKTCLDTAYGNGARVADDTFIIPDGVEAGIPQRYYDEADVENLLSGFQIEYLEIEDRRILKPKQYLYSRWIVFARRT